MAVLLFLVPEFRLGTENEELCVAVGFGVSGSGVTEFERPLCHSLAVEP